MTTLFDTRDPGPMPPRRKPQPAQRHVLRRDDGRYARQPMRERIAFVRAAVKRMQSTGARI